MTTIEKAQQENRERLERWFADEDTVACIFENHDLGSRMVGTRIALPYRKAEAQQMRIKIDRAPDTSMGLGWRYILVAKCDDVQATLEALANDRRQ